MALDNSNADFTPVRCEHGHTHYSEEELLDCSKSANGTHQRRGSSFSANSLVDMDASLEDFWNMTLDDLDLSQSAHARMERRRSDGMSPIKSVSKKQMPRRLVSFGKVEVRVCERVLGDNPACHGQGPSLSIGWNYETKQEVAIDAWEKKRIKQRRSSEELVMSAAKREKIAKRSGYTKQEIKQNVELMAKYQRRRERTRKEIEKDAMAKLLSQSKQQTLAKFLQGKERKSRGNASSSLRSLRSI